MNTLGSLDIMIQVSVYIRVFYAFYSLQFKTISVLGL